MDYNKSNGPYIPDPVDDCAIIVTEGPSKDR